MVFFLNNSLSYEKFEDVKIVFRSCRSKNDRQYSGQKTNNVYKTLHIKLKIEHIEPIAGAPAVPTKLLALVVLLLIQTR